MKYVSMDIVRFKGGLGNQMFQYALVEALRSRGREVYCNLGFYRRHPDLRPFIIEQVFRNLNLNEIDDSAFDKVDEKWKKIKNDENKLKNYKKDNKNIFFYVENEDGKYDEDIFKTINCTFVGYWQSEKYFKNIRNQILRVFDFTNLEPKLKEFGEQLKKTYISIHIRRGDYLKFAMYQTISLEYYWNSIDYINNIFPDAKFIVFSDDTNWVSKIFDLDNMIVCKPEFFDDYKDWYDMYLMTLCKGNIIANSSFSWWGAWLNKNEKAITISPRKWLDGYETPDIWCDKWIRI